jgi:F0F1-type ATP synthase membrane subunit b/b'
MVAQATLVPRMQSLRVMLDKSDELKDRVEARRHQLLSKFNELKADTRKEASEARSKLKARLDEIEDTLKTGWNNISEAAKTKLNQWLDREDRDD